MSAVSLRWFASDTADIVFVYITSVVESMHIFMARNRAFESCLMSELCFYSFAHFDCVLIYIFRNYHKQCVSNYNDLALGKFTSQLFSNADESLKDETRLLLP